MYSIYEKLVELCPVIKELLVDEGAIRPGGGQGGHKNDMLVEQNNVVMNEMLARLVNLQQFV